MEIYSTRVFRKKPRVGVLAKSSYSSSLQFYSVPPIGDISLNEFDEMALERLKVLRAVERINLSGLVKNSEEWMNKLFDDFQKNKYFIMIADRVTGTENEEVLNARRRDHVSHFILRLAYCRNEELRRWLVTQETDLFRARFMRVAAGGGDFATLLKDNNLHFQQIAELEFRNEANKLAAGTHNINGMDQLEDKVFYKVPFTEALDLVRNRKVYIKSGFAFVPSSDLVTLVTAAFRSKLSEALTVTCRSLPQINDDERLVNLLQDFDKRYTGNDYSQKKPGDGPQITPEMINKLSVTSFPLCMRHMQEHLVANNHMKHGGRLQYGLFLKAAGLRLEDALRFWRSHFTKIMDSDKFDKQYAYAIRHNYGKEGKRTDYTPYTCMKIIMSAPGPLDCHGCPFKFSDSAVLKNKLISHKISPEGVTDIMDLVSHSHFQIACQRYFELKHNSSLECGINHPNQYFEESMALLYGNKTPSKGLKSSLKYQHSVMNSQPISSESSQDTAEISGIDSMLDDDFDNALSEEMAKFENLTQNSSS